MTLPIALFVFSIVMSLYMGIVIGGMIEGVAQVRRDVKKFKENPYGK